MGASSSSAAAADPRPPKHDVFLSFRGEDTREKFTAHLYSALSGKQIEAYKDDANLKKGDTISPALLEAIEESEISIIIFSPNYASSSWCLDELVHILKCKKEKARIVLPIFIDINPAHIRKQEGSYAAAFEKHEKRFKSEKVRGWRQALTEAANLSGWDSRNMPDESVIVKEVVERVRTELDTIMSKRSDDLKGLVGIPERLEKVKSYLDSPAVRVGIWGMGGIGKTTLAEVVFDRFYNDFEGSYFARDVRENAINKGLATLKEEVYSELLGDKNLRASSAVNKRLSCKRILLVLDDVEDAMQFEDLVGDPYRFCPGSKIIVTSRDKLKVDAEYKVEELYSEDARKLFYLNAFGHESCRRGFEGISDRVVEYTKGLPLALKVLGASVFYFLESIEEWEKELKKLKRIRNDKIQKVLEISYDALDAEEKGLFLDIACFFKGQRKEFVEGILEDKPIRGLVNRSLITIDRHGVIDMHDLIQEMGRKLGERSRLWIDKDFSDALENNKGIEAIEGIYFPWIDRVVHLRPDVFEEMPKLRLLKFFKESNYYAWRRVRVAIDGDLKYLPNSLRYLHWEDYPGKSLPSNFKPQNLVELHMPNSKLEQLWDGVQKLGSLKHINLHDSKLLTKIPDLSLAPKLECINLSGCKSLIHIPSLNLNLQATVDESAYMHQWLCVEDEGFRFRDARTPGCIILNGCLGLTTLLKVSGNIRRLVLRETALKELPSSIQSLENLLLLDLRKCMKLKSLPKLPRNIEVLLLDHSGIEQIPSSSIKGLCSLRQLDLRECKSLSSLPSNINLKALEELILAGTSIQELPSTIKNSIGLKKLDINGCENLRSLPASIGMLSKLEELVIGNLQSVPASIGNLNSLKTLYIQGCENLQSIPKSIGMLYNLKWLSIWNCKNLQSLPESIGKLSNLATLRIDECKNLQSVPATIGMLCNLKSFNIRKCENLQSLPASIGLLSKLEELDLSYCKNLQSVPASIGNLNNLKTLYMDECKNLQSVPASIPMLCNLKRLSMWNCKNLQSLPESIGMLCNLKSFDIRNCENLQSLLASIGMLYKLKKLDIRNCKSLQSLPELPLFIESVNAEDCSSLEMVSSLRSTLTLGRWLDKYDYYYPRREFSFVNCTNLGEDAINNIFTEFLYKVFCTATTPSEVVHSKVQRVILEVVVCYPTEEIPRWFNNQSEGSSITITLPPNWYNPKTFLGFVVSLLFAKDEDVNFTEICDLCLLTNKDCFRLRLNFPKSTTSSFDHILMWYAYFDHSKENFEKYQEASLRYCKGPRRVKRCGLRMLYLKDAIEESDDGIIANFESWRIDSDTDYATTYDSDEPPHKRTRNL